MSWLMFRKMTWRQPPPRKKKWRQPLTRLSRANLRVSQVEGVSAWRGSYLQAWGVPPRGVRVNVSMLEGDTAHCMDGEPLRSSNQLSITPLVRGVSRLRNTLRKSTMNVKRGRLSDNLSCHLVWEGRLLLLSWLVTWMGVGVTRIIQIFHRLQRGNDVTILHRLIKAGGSQWKAIVRLVYTCFGATTGSPTQYLISNHLTIVVIRCLVITDELILIKKPWFDNLIVVSFLDT